jgi:hypothetical protein
MAKIKPQLKKESTEKKKSFSFSFDPIKKPVAVFFSKLKRSKNEMSGMFGRKKKALNGQIAEIKKNGSKVTGSFSRPQKKQKPKKKRACFCC